MEITYIFEVSLEDTSQTIDLSLSSEFGNISFDGISSSLSDNLHFVEETSVSASSLSSAAQTWTYFKDIATLGYDTVTMAMNNTEMDENYQRTWLNFYFDESNRGLGGVDLYLTSTFCGSQSHGNTNGNCNVATFDTTR